MTDNSRSFLCYVKGIWSSLAMKSKERNEGKKGLKYCEMSKTRIEKRRTLSTKLLFWDGFTNQSTHSPSSCPSNLFIPSFTFCSFFIQSTRSIEACSKLYKLHLCSNSIKPHHFYFVCYSSSESIDSHAQHAPSQQLPPRSNQQRTVRNFVITY